MIINTQRIQYEMAPPAMLPQFPRSRQAWDLQNSSKNLNETPYLKTILRIQH